MIAAATRLRDAWKMPEPDILEMHEAALELISATGTSNVHWALDVLHEVESGRVSMAMKKYPLVATRSTHPSERMFRFCPE
jgi:hypothetical protein